MERIDSQTVKLTEAEQVISEWHEVLMNQGLSPIEAVDHIMSRIPIKVSTTWKLLANADFRLWLMH